VRHVARRDLRRAAVELLAVVAEYGHDDDAGRERAFEAGKARFGKWANDHTYSSREHYSLATLDRSLDVLATLNGKGRRTMLEAVTTVAAYDGEIAIAEAELIRAICASLNVPLPPLLTS
jgi:hypothetical protein